ncbi:tRNA (adenosine(37)-N6)-threonylcarbamoyltransferase complex dimerization subunit type 1 TsaB [Planctomycetales bacterium]|nr:tRNA (adenosine(37)-N6)-threonylcarbamoyltransferase complex dimerization subunit type 1 TsaB [Planctomycetales bacterium]
MSIIFAVETVEKFGSIALLENRRVLTEFRLPEDRRSAQTLFPALRSIFQEADIAPEKVDIVAALAGPGSFTGLRVGITTAKLFAYSTGAKVISVNTFETVAAGMLQQENPPKHLTIGVDAQRGEIAVQDYYLLNGEKQYEPDSSNFVLLPFEQWKEKKEQRNLCFTGPALERYAVKMPPDANVADREFWFPRAGVAGQLASELLKNQKREFVSPFDLLPIYSRLSAAEERLLKLT